MSYKKKMDRGDNYNVDTMYTTSFEFSCKNLCCTVMEEPFWSNDPLWSPIERKHNVFPQHYLIAKPSWGYIKELFLNLLKWKMWKIIYFTEYSYISLSFVFLLRAYQQPSCRLVWCLFRSVASLLHRNRRSHGFESCSSLHCFQAFFWILKVFWLISESYGELTRSGKMKLALQYLVSRILYLLDRYNLALCVTKLYAD